MKVYYREHRSGVQESLETEKQFKSFEDLKDYLRKRYNLKNNTIINYYCFDKRFGIGTTFIVTDGLWNDEQYGGVLGFAYLKDYKGDGLNENNL